MKGTTMGDTIGVDTRKSERILGGLVVNVTTIGGSVRKTTRMKALVRLRGATLRQSGNVRLPASTETDPIKRLVLPLRCHCGPPCDFD